MTLIRLPWPPRALWPNQKDKAHWQATRTEKKEYAATCGWLIKGQRGSLRENEGTHLRVTFHAPHNRRYDLDNSLAAIKSGLDALRDTWGVDDSEWTYTLSKGEKVKDGCVLIEIKEPDAVFIPLAGVVT